MFEQQGKKSAVDKLYEGASRVGEELERRERARLHWRLIVSRPDGELAQMRTDPMQRSAQSNKPWMPAFCAWRSRHTDIAGVIENPNWQPDGKGWFLPHNSVHYDGAIVHIDFARKDRAPIHLLDYPFLHTLRMSFGKYRGELVYEVPEIDIGYVNWLLRQPWFLDECAPEAEIFHRVLKKMEKDQSRRGSSRHSNLNCRVRHELP